MESLPVELIGNILSLLRHARDVVIASATCRIWREALRNHLYILSFNSNDWPGYHYLTTYKLEIIITQTILQTKGLQCLSIEMHDVGVFSAAPVIAWLMHTRGTLQQLFCNIRTTMDTKYLGKCGRQKLETVILSHNTITGVEPSYMIFPCLRSLSLCHVTISPLNLCLLLTACPKLESLFLCSLDIFMPDGLGTVELSSSSLKDFYVGAIVLDKLVLQADSLEYLHLNDCVLRVFKLISKGALKILKIDDVRIVHFDIGDNFENLEVVDVNNTFTLPNFYHLISWSSKLRRLRLWGIIAFEHEIEALDLDTISVSFPQLSHLSLCYDLRDEMLRCSSQGPYHLENVVVLELGRWTVISDLFLHWVEVLLARCSNLKKLVIYGDISNTRTHKECHILANFITSLVQLMRKHMHVEFQFKYE